MEVAIIGAGISGLTAAKHIQQRAIIFEKSNHIGGLSTQYRSGKYWFDFGGHYFHFKDKLEIKHYLEQFCKFNKYNRKSLSYLFNRYIPYPIQYHLSYLPHNLTIKIREEIPELSYLNPQNLDEFLQQNFGMTLYHAFFKPFLTKFYNWDLDLLAADMEKGSIPVADKSEMLSGLKGKRFKKIGYNPLFFYPRKSLRHFFQIFTRDLKEQIYLNEEVKRIDFKRKILVTTHKSYPYKYLINTMPLNHFLQRIIPTSLFNSSSQLNHISTLVVNVVLSNRRKRFHWTYLPERAFPFYRVGFYPGQKSPVCYLEKTISLKDSIDETSLFKEINRTLSGLQLIEDPREIIYFSSKIIPVSYVVFDHKWTTLVPRILKELKKYNVFSIGRYGAWNYTSMADDVKSAIETAMTIQKEIGVV